MPRTKVEITRQEKGWRKRIIYVLKMKDLFSSKENINEKKKAVRMDEKKKSIDERLRNEDS